mmetsp:Transcript_14340/g.37166  ORF Transcript_14340/g.37166 Transcript_14340/m.37166 type:complete len:206 (+) Transcript_14340:111-728(+)
MTISDQLPHDTVAAKPRRPSQEGPTKDAGRHEFAKHSTIEDVIGESRDKRASVSQLVGDEFRQPFTIGDEPESDKVQDLSQNTMPTPQDVAHQVRSRVERERRSTQEEAAKGFLHANPTGVAGVDEHFAKYAEASTVGAGGHGTPKLPVSGDKVEKTAAAQGAASRRVRSATMEAAEAAAALSSEQMRQAEKSLALHAEIESAKR